MTPRAFAILVCLIASSRWPRLRFVAAALACEAVSSDVVPIWQTTEAMIAWLAPSICMTSIGLLFALRKGWIAAPFAACQGAAYVAAGTRHGIIAAIAASSFVFSSVQLARRVSPDDVECSVMLALLAGNVAAFVMMVLVGVDAAYANGIVSTSNDLTHLAVAGRVLWSMRR